MPNTQQTPSTPPKKVGRPPTGRTREIIKATVDRKIVAEAKALAFKNGESFSSFVSRAVHSQILRNL